MLLSGRAAIEPDLKPLAAVLAEGQREAEPQGSEFRLSGV